MYYYEIQMHGVPIAIKSMLGSPVLNAFLDPLSTSVSGQFGANFRRDFESRTSTKPDWEGIDQLTVDSLATSPQQEQFHCAFEERKDRAMEEDDFIYWIEPPQPERPKPNRPAFLIGLSQQAA